MTADTLISPPPPTDGPTDEDDIHLWCCDPNRAWLEADAATHHRPRALDKWMAELSNASAEERDAADRIRDPQ